MPKYRATAVLTWEFWASGPNAAQEELDVNLTSIELCQASDYKGFRNTEVTEMETDDAATK